MKVNVRINRTYKISTGMQLDRHNKLRITFEDGAAKEKARQFFKGHDWKRPDDRYVSVPGRNIFQQYMNERSEKVIAILKRSNLLRFKKYTVKQQLLQAGTEIVEDIADFVYAGNITPDNGKYWKERKDNLPVGIYTGEMIAGLICKYVREP